MLLPTASDFVACADVAPEHQSQPGFDSHSESDIVEPKKTRNVAPRYPPASQKGGIQGTVVLEAMIARTGCVSMVRVLRSVHASLDFEAIRAVLQWRYTPTLFKGEPVDTQMTVTVNFSLR